MTGGTKGRIGSSSDDFPREDGSHAEVTARAIKRVLARSLDSMMKERGLSKSALAERMHTSRSQLDRLLHPANNSVTPDTLVRAARAVGRKLHLELRQRRGLGALAMTLAELSDIAAAAITGDSSGPKAGWSTPAAIGAPAAL